MNEKYKELITKAIDAKKYAYIPFSHFAVGAALLCSDGKVYTGCNIENSSYTPTICAERTAMSKAISEGEKSFEAIAIAGGSGDDYIVPCGVCRQFMYEFCEPDFPVILIKNENDFIIKTLGELLPMGFRLKPQK